MTKQQLTMTFTESEVHLIKHEAALNKVSAARVVSDLIADGLKHRKKQGQKEFMPEDYHTREEWIRMMSRAGFSPEFILKGGWSTIDVWAIIAGWFDRVEDHKIILQASGMAQTKEKRPPMPVATENGVNI